MSQSTYTKGLRDLADFLDGQPTLITPSSGVTAYYWILEPLEGESRESLVQRFRAAAALLGEDAKTGSSGSYFNVTRDFGPHRFQVTMKHEVIAPAPPHPLELPPEMDDDA